MVDKPACSASAAHMSAVKAMGFADWFPRSVRKQEFVQEVSARVRASESLCMYTWARVKWRVCMNRFLMPLCLCHFSSEKTLMVSGNKRVGISHQDHSQHLACSMNHSMASKLCFNSLLGYRHCLDFCCMLLQNDMQRLNCNIFWKLHIDLYNESIQNGIQFINRKLSKIGIIKIQFSCLHIHFLLWLRNPIQKTHKAAITWVIGNESSILKAFQVIISESLSRKIR